MNTRTRSVIRCALISSCMAMSALSLNAGVEKFDKESIEYVLSWWFSSMTVTNAPSEREYAAILMDHRGATHFANNLIRHQKDKTRTGDELRFRSGDAFRFSVLSGLGGLTVSVTNEYCVKSGNGVERLFRSEHDLMVVINTLTHRSDPCDWPPSYTYRHYVIDADVGTCCDVERDRTTPFKFPFKALWKDYNDYLRKTTDSDKDIKSTYDRYNGLCSRAVDSPHLREYCARMPDRHSAVVCFYEDDFTIEPALSHSVYLAEVSREGTNITIRGVAMAQGDSKYEIVRMNEHHHPWVVLRVVSTNSADLAYFEYTGEGRLKRHVRGGDSPLYRDGDSLSGTKDYDAAAKEAFVREVGTETKILKESWLKSAYERVYTPHRPTQKEIEKNRKTKELAKKRDKEFQEEICRRESEWNAERRAKGLPDYAPDEMKKKWREHYFQMRVARMADLRIKMTGGKPATELDLKYDVERARVMKMYDVAREYAHEKGFSASHRKELPTNLRQLVGFKRYGRMVLPEGEKALLDGWGREYDYRIERRSASGFPSEGVPVVISAGVDGKFGTEDDISSLELLRLQNMFRQY